MMSPCDKDKARRAGNRNSTEHRSVCRLGANFFKQR
jgi:hypothetical protein